MKKSLFWILACTSFWAHGQNGADFWQKMPSPPGGELEVYYNNASDTLYGKYYTGQIYRSIDAGHSWQEDTIIFRGNNINNRVQFGQHGTLFYTNYTLQEDTTWASKDRGQTWQFINMPPYITFSENAAGTLIGMKSGSFPDSYEIHRSTDFGNTWIITDTIFATIQQYNGDPVKPYLNGVVVLFNSFSKDDGLTWKTILNPPSADSITNLWVSPEGDVFCCTTQKFYHSYNNGNNWETTLPDELFWGPGENKKMLFFPSGKILADMGMGQIQSNDWGSTWYSTNQYDLASEIPLPNGTVFGSTYNGLYQSADEGQTWSFSSYGIDKAIINDLDIANDSTIFATTPAGVWRTRDGTNWDFILPFGEDVSLGAGQFVVMRSNGVFVSDNWGDTLVKLESIEYNRPAFVNPADNTLFATKLFPKVLVRSVNAGTSWVTTSLQGEVVQMKFHPSGRMFANAKDGSLWLSDDGGFNWQVVTGLPVTFTQQAVYGLNISPDGDIFHTGNTASGRVVIRSADNGVSWVKLPSLPGNGVSVEKVKKNSQGHLFTVTNNRVYRSVDLGLSWQTLPQISNFGLTNCLEILPGEYLYTGTYGGGFYRTSNPIQSGAYLHGTVIRDADGDCSTEDVQPHNFKNWVVAADGANDFYINPDTAGQFNMFLDLGFYDVTLQAPNDIWWDLCDTTQTVLLDEQDGVDSVQFSALALADCPLISVHVAAPFLRRCFNSPVSVQYCNLGTETADSAWVDVTLDYFLSFISSSKPHQDLGNNVVRFFLGDVLSGDCGQFNLTVYVNCDSTVIGQTHCVSAHGFPDTLCTTIPNWSGANLEAMVACQDSVVLFELENTGNSPSQLLDYIIIEDDVVMFQGSKQYQPNENLLIPLPANGHTYRVESEQEPGHPFSYRVIAFEEGCGGYESLGYINQFSVNGETPSVHQICVENTGSYDPNDKRGFPAGTGDEHRIRPGQAIEYMIRFQNTGTDTAFTVVIRDTLTHWLNPASVTPGAASHPYSWTMEGQGVVKFTFNNILLPDSSTNLAGSQGFVTFSVAQQPEVPLGTQIRNDAAIFFDFNAPVITNKTLHTVGLDLLSSTVDIPSQAKPTAVNLSPNPALDHTRFQLRKGNFDGHRLQLFDLLGKPVFDTEVNGAQFVMPRGHLPAGAYGWRVMDRRGGLVESGVLVFQ